MDQDTELIIDIDIPFSNNKYDPAIINNLNKITLTCNDEIDFGTLDDGLRIYEIKNDWSEVEYNINIEHDNNSPNIFHIVNPDFNIGELYKLSINSNLKSENKNSLKNEFNSYFTVDYKFNLESNGINEMNSTRSIIVCISDLHLGANDAYAEINRNRADLVDFLEKIRIHPNIKELVIIGDLIDEWFIPMEVDTFEGKNQISFVEAVASNNKPVIDAFNNIISDGNVKVTYIPGNHDILITSEDLQNILPGINEVRDVKGLGVYSPEDLPELIIEHGHRYNFFCAPDYSNRQKTETDSILPPGYFFTRIATSSVMQGRPNIDVKLPTIMKNEHGEDQFHYYLYWCIWRSLILDFPVHESLEDKVIYTDIDGFTDVYSINDVLPYQNPENNCIDLNLYKGIVESWDERQSKNLVPIKIPIEEAILKAASTTHLDHQSDIQFFNNPYSKKRIVIFGHTHEARLIKSFNDEEKNIYINSGTWIDKKDPTMTFVVVKPAGRDSLPTFISLYKYSGKGGIIKLDSDVIT